MSTENELALSEAIFATGFCHINSLVNTNVDLALDLIPTTSALILNDNHYPLFVLLNNVYDGMQCVPERHENSKFDIKECDYSALNSAFDGTDFNILLGNGNVDEVLSFFYGRLTMSSTSTYSPGS